MIKKLEAEDIVKILSLKDDDFSILFTCEVGEWVQFLMQNVENENFFMMGYFKDEKLIGYLIAYFVSIANMQRCICIIFKNSRIDSK
jgi:hypothetical protein